MQNPTPQLNVLSISLSEIFFDFSQEKIFKILIFDKSMLIESWFGTDLDIFSIIPPPVILVAE